MPTDREREYYRMGYSDGIKDARRDIGPDFGSGYVTTGQMVGMERRDRRKPKRKLSAWNKFVKANSKKPRFVLRSGKLNLKKLGVAFRKTPAGKKKKGR